jgi:GT2 family glycosyltransferase
MVFVLILNWNGWEDTLECLASLRRSSYAAIQVVVLDNGSSDDSLARIEAWATGGPEGGRVVRYTRGEAEAGGDAAREAAVFGDLPHRGRLILVENGANLGFAAGNNVGIRFAIQRGSDYVFLLNNDTVAAPQAVEQLVALLAREQELVGATAQIRYYDTDVVWNCGGDLTWYGGRRYHLHGATAAQVKAAAQAAAAQAAAAQGRAAQGGAAWRPISFITGCAAFFRTELFSTVGLLSERFFFGEEDFEFSQRLKREGLRLGCAYGAVVRHKVSRSVNQAAQTQAADTALANKVRLYYLNRFIDMRSYYPRPLWHLWRLVYMAYIFVLLAGRLRLGVAPTTALLRSVWVESAQLHGIDQATFTRVLQGKPARAARARE